MADVNITGVGLTDRADQQNNLPVVVNATNGPLPVSINSSPLGNVPVVINATNGPLPVSFNSSPMGNVPVAVNATNGPLPIVSQVPPIFAVGVGVQLLGPMSPLAGTVIDVKGDWLRLQTSDGIFLWVNAVTGIAWQ